MDPQLIDGLPTDLVDLSINEAGACALGGDERVYCWAHDETTAQQISGDAFDALSGGAADLHCARREDKSELLCWGSNAAYVLGDAVISSSVLPRAVPGLVGDIGLFTADATYHIPSVCAADSEGLKCWGSNSYRLQANAPFLRREPGLILPWE